MESTEHYRSNDSNQASTDRDWRVRPHRRNVNSTCGSNLRIFHSLFCYSCSVFILLSVDTRRTVADGKVRLTIVATAVAATRIAACIMQRINETAFHQTCC